MTDITLSSLVAVALPAGGNLLAAVSDGAGGSTFGLVLPSTFTTPAQVTAAITAATASTTSVTPAQLATATTNLVTTTQLNTATSGLVTTTQLTNALSPLASTSAVNNAISAATTNLVTTTQLNTAIAAVPAGTSGGQTAAQVTAAVALGIGNALPAFPGKILFGAATAGGFDAVNIGAGLSFANNTLTATGSTATGTATSAGPAVHTLATSVTAYTLGAGDDASIIRELQYTSLSAGTITLPTASALGALGVTGFAVVITTLSTILPVLAPDSTSTMVSAQGAVTHIGAQYGQATARIVATSPNTVWAIDGNLA